MTAAHKEVASALKLPQFFLEVDPNGIFGDSKKKLNPESLLGDFKLGREDSKIDFEQISSDLYKVDIEETNQYTAKFTKVESEMARDRMTEYILAKPQEGQIKDISHQLVQMIGNMYPIADQEIRIYVERILGGLDTAKLQDILIRKLTYSDKIRAKIKEHTDRNSEATFNDFVKVGRIIAEPHWSFPKEIVPGKLGAEVGGSLYEREGEMNGFEVKVISELSALSNISFWHRNLGKGKGFSINGFKSNHYPDFILVTKKGHVILLETKGGDRDNSDSAAKNRLGKKWEELAGKKFHYFMVFEKNEIEGAYSLEKAKELVGMM